MVAKGRPIQIVILGGGFGGIYTARTLEHLWKDDPTVAITLVSRNNYFLMTPLLFEAGSGVLEPRHAVNPIRPLFDRARFIEAEVQSIDLEQKTITVVPPESTPDIVQFDHLVLALGGVTNTNIIPGSEQALTFKTLGDAIFLRNHVIQLFERADIEQDPARKRALLTFVIVGGGLVAVELAGELSEFLNNLTKLYPQVERSEVRIEMIEAGPYIAAEFDEELRDYAADTLRKSGVNIRSKSPVKAIERSRAQLPDGTWIDAETIILAAGVATNPLVAALPIQKDKKGRAETEPTMQCKGRTDLWALGDCASIPDPTGKPYPALAQHALREARVLGRNITAAIRGQPMAPFVYKTKGTLAALGHFKGIGKVYMFRIRGFVAWWVWRTYYLFQMPRWNRRIRIVLDWTISLFFKNDIVQLDLFGDEHPRTRQAKES